MPVAKTFGRRTVARERPPSPRVVPAPGSRPDAALVMSPPPQDDPVIDVDAEIEAWSAARKAKKRSFREPWRTLAIVSSIGFGLSTWLLPESVAEVVNTLTLGLCGASFYAGLRSRRPAIEHDST